MAKCSSFSDSIEMAAHIGMCFLEVLQCMTPGVAKHSTSNPWMYCIDRLTCAAGTLPANVSHLRISKACYTYTQYHAASVMLNFIVRFKGFWLGYPRLPGPGIMSTTCTAVMSVGKVRHVGHLGLPQVCLRLHGSRFAYRPIQVLRLGF
jgi:hypothetical protein